MRALLASAFLLGLTGAACAEDCKPLQVINSVKTQPLAQSGLITVPITLNGVEKRFLLNTGAAVDQITRATIDELKLPIKHARTRVTRTNGTDSTDYVNVYDLAYGQQRGATQFMVMNNPQLPFDGALAIDSQNRQDLDLDFGAQRVNYFSTDHCEGKVVYWPHQALSVVPVSLEQHHIDVQVELDGHPMRAVIDTGSTRTSLRLTRAKEILGFSPDTPTTGNVPKDDPEKQIYPRRFTSLSIDGVTIQNPLVVIQPLEFGGGKDDDLVTGSRAIHKDDDANRLSSDMVIGMDILRHLHLYLASRESKLYVTEAGQGESVLFKTAAPDK